MKTRRLQTAQQLSLQEYKMERALLSLRSYDPALADYLAEIKEVPNVQSLTSKN